MKMPSRPPMAADCRYYLEDKDCKFYVNHQLRRKLNFGDPHVKHELPPNLTRIHDLTSDLFIFLPLCDYISMER